MNLNIFNLKSLKTRVSLFTLTFFLIGIWFLALYASRVLREDTQNLVGNQQFSTASLVAEQINQEIENRIQSLESIAFSISTLMQGNTATLQIVMEQNTVFQSQFNAGTFVAGPDCIVIADVPLSAGRIGVNISDRDYIHTVFIEEKTTISQPLISKKRLTPAFVMATPIRDTRGKVIGVLVGVIDLEKPNFLDRIVQNKYGKTGGYVLIEPKNKIVITATDKSLIMTPLPKPGINPLLDQYMQGFEGFGHTVDARGVEVVSAAKQIPVPGWFLVARMPALEAFAPIRNTQRSMLLIAISMSLVVGGMIWWMLSRQLAPMLTAAKILASNADTDLPLQPLPITRQDEIGKLISGFNRLLEILSERDQALQANRKRLSDIIEFLPDPTMAIDKEGQVIIWNKAIEEMTGIPAAEMIGKGDYAYSVPFYGEAKPLLMDLIFMDDEDLLVQYPGMTREGAVLTAEVFCNALHNNNGAWVFLKVSPLYDQSGNVTGVIESLRDISDKKRSEKELLHANETLELRVAQEVEKNMEQERILVRQSRLAAMGEMIGNIAHQWRQPLNALGILLFNIKDAYQFNTLDAAYLDQAIADGNRMVQKMSTTISDFANFFRPDKEIKIFSALKQIKDAISLVELSFQNSNISIHINATHDLKLLGFPNEYSQVLLNLLSNAKEAIIAHNHMHAGRVDIILTEQDGLGCVSVCDNGGGIPEEILDRIFDPYYSTKVKGSGIGLYMSEMIIERNMNGSITARNIEGGAEFIVCTPLTKDGPFEPL